MGGDDLSSALLLLYIEADRAETVALTLASGLGSLALREPSRAAQRATITIYT